MTKCDNCNGEIKGFVYTWQGLNPIYCSSNCAAWGCPNVLLIQSRVK